MATPRRPGDGQGSASLEISLFPYQERLNRVDKKEGISAISEGLLPSAAKDVSISARNGSGKNVAA
jgi:hypothetical protein